ncbi:MAG: hypothetical protein RSB37_01315 [Acetivibrio sp.]
MQSLQNGRKSIKMGLFKRFSKKSVKKMGTPLQKEEVLKTVQEVQPQKAVSITNVVDCCEQMVEIKRQIEEMKGEYHIVSSYLTDIQKIDMIPSDEREVIEKAAENITLYTKEREKYKGKDEKITSQQRSMLEKQGKEIAEELKTMRGNESYNGIIKGDLYHLEGEKGALLFEQEELIEKQAFLKKTVTTMAVLVISVFALMMVLSLAFEESMAIPFLLTIVLAAIIGFYIFIQANQNRQDMQLVGRKLHKAIRLLNKVKIKYVNNMSLLEYAYEKFDVSSSTELEYIWKQFLIARENEKKYELNTEKLKEAKDLLLCELKKYQISDGEIWLYQAEAINDKREMVEVRHRLNIRRQKLRDNLDYNNKTYAQNKKEIQEFVDENKKMRDEVMDTLRNYDLNL